MLMERKRGGGEMEDTGNPAKRMREGTYSNGTVGVLGTLVLCLRNSRNVGKVGAFTTGI